MMISTCVLLIVQAVVTAAGAAVKVKLNPAGVKINGYQQEPDYDTWNIPENITTAATFQNLSFTLSGGTGSILKGGSYKFIFTKFLSVLGERIVGEAISTDLTTGQSLTLTIEGLAAGNHSLLSYHNAWDALAAASNISVAVDGNIIIRDQAQSVRVDNIWDSASSYINFTARSGAKVEIKYMPLSSSGSVDKRVFLNGFEIDTANVKEQTSFPTPSHTDEHVDGDSGSIVASWNASTIGFSVIYDVYFGRESPQNMQKLVSGHSSTEVTFSNISSLETYYWRVDVLSEGRTILGRVWSFRPRQLAFAGAEGWGRFARGGRGGKPVKVTSLDDYAVTDAPRPGTLRYALTAEIGPRTIIFEVGGVITLTSRLTVSSNYITVAGQTAPGNGIVIQGWPFGLSGASDVVVQHLRVRPGTISGQTVDGMGMQGSNHAIFDHCSMGWSIDESFSSRSAYNITFQHSMISEPLNVAGHKNYPVGTAHGYAASIGGDVGSFHHNLIAHAWGRSWSMAGGVDAVGAFAGRLDIRNNIVYNFGDRVTDGGAHQVNFVGNYYKPGPSSNKKFDLKATYEDTMPGTQTYFCDGNSMHPYFEQNSEQVLDVPGNATQGTVLGACWASISISPEPIYQRFYNQPFFNSYITTHTSTEAYKNVLSMVSARSPFLDAHDTRIIKETLTNTTTYSGSITGHAGIIDATSDVGGLEEFPTITRPESWDTDNDGVPDWWDGSNGGEKGWNALDGYLQFMSGPHAFVEPGKELKISLRALSLGFVEPATYMISMVRGNGTVSLSESDAVYKAPSTGPLVNWLAMSLVDAEGSVFEQSIGVAVVSDAEDIQ